MNHRGEDKQESKVKVRYHSKTILGKKYLHHAGKSLRKIG